MKKTVTITIVMGVFIYAYIAIRAFDAFVYKVIQFIYSLNPG